MKIGMQLSNNDNFVSLVGRAQLDNCLKWQGRRFMSWLIFRFGAGLPQRQKNRKRPEKGRIDIYRQTIPRPAGR